jgi:hypothetical protein
MVYVVQNYLASFGLYPSSGMWKFYKKTTTFRRLDLSRPQVAQHTYEEGHRISWDEARVLEVESNSRYRKYKESAHMACSTNPTSQPSLGISPIWIPLINEEVNKTKE